MEKNLKGRIVNKHDIESNWALATNFIPKKGEIIIYDADSENTKPRLKIGDGTTVVSSLPFLKGEPAQGEQVQTDWEQNDTESVDYIKNRTHYKEVGTTTIFPETTITISNEDNPQTQLSPTFEINLQNTYVVKWNNVTYTCSPKEYQGIPGIGNLSFFGQTDTGEPFVIYYMGGEMGTMAMTQSTGTYNLEVSRQGIIYHKLSTDYLPTLIGLSGTGNGSEIFNYSSNIASGDYSHAEGYDTEASQLSSHAEGYGTTASGQKSHAEGWNTKAEGESSHTEGENTTASGQKSHAEGSYTTASGTDSHAEGNHTIASNICSHAEGAYSKAKANYSHAEGSYTTASGLASHAEGGSSNIASNSYDETTTESTIYTDWQANKFSMAKAYYSHVEGKDCLALGSSSHAEGYQNVAYGTYSHAGGSNNVANRLQTVIGRYANTDGTLKGGVTDTSLNGSLFVVGNGTMSARGNAFRVSAAGAVYGLSSFNSSGADYAEYFEWADGNEYTEDRVGYFVTFEGANTIRKAGAGDEILGVISETASVIGDSYEDNWQGMYVRDNFGRFIHEIVKTKDGEEIERIKLNPEYNSTLEYTPRSQRKEWSCVGLIGKLIVRDDGSCEVGGNCKCNNEGIATKSETTGYRVLERIDENIIRIFIK